MIRCGICYGSVAMKGGGRGSVNEVERVEEGEKGGGWGMVITAVNALTCNMDLIA